MARWDLMAACQRNHNAEQHQFFRSRSATASTQWQAESMITLFPSALTSPNRPSIQPVEFGRGRSIV